MKHTKSKSSFSVTRRIAMFGGAAALSGIRPGIAQTVQARATTPLSDQTLAQNFGWPKEPLKAVAARKNMRFGTCVDREIFTYPAYGRLVGYECSILVGETGLTWRLDEPTPSNFDFSLADRIADFAKSQNIPLRGHTLLWDKALPGWVSDPKSQAIDLMAAHIRTVCGYYGSSIVSWDVVNEAIRTQDGRPDGLGNNAFLRTAGPDYIATAFNTARAAAPQAELVYNDWIDGYDNSYFEKRRTSCLHLLESLVNRKVPISALGIQSHLNAGRKDFSEKIWGVFCNEIRNLGLSIVITELDCSDDGLPAAAATRDQAVADCVRRYLDVTLHNAPVRDVLVWGLSDRFSDLERISPRSDGLVPRGAPYDADLQAKPMREAIRAALESAPAYVKRGPTGGRP